MLVCHLHNVHALLAVLARADGRDGAALGSADRTRPLPDSAHLGTPLESHAGHVAGPDRLFGALSGGPDPTLGGLWPSRAIDSTILLAHGGVWHKKDRDQGVVPHTSIDTEAHWTKSGWHGWCYGWKLHLVAPAAADWIPLAADLTPANEADNEVAPALLWELPGEARFVLGDPHGNAPNVQETVTRPTGTW